MDIETIITTVVAALGGGGIGSIIGWRAKKRQENAGAAKAEAEAKGDQIENIEKMVEKAYKPIIEDLTQRIQKLQEKVEQLEGEKDAQNERIDELEAENRKLRSALRELAPDSIPSRRGENAKSQARNPDGTFARKAEGDYQKDEGSYGK
jgi:predicted RNase H-like nuclease (RuvC/YqgF family)